ncbi:MAG TPA: gamma-glutamylcyclotransferase family protein [Polyangiaceae bacterium]|jgi:gamma-glutamylcyclotransferase (GGCT)/AIG2-like uncharacterized protein YtfP
MTGDLAPKRRYTLFVYGTLLRGEASHALLKDAAALGAATTTAAFDLFDLGPYPALVTGGTTPIAGEVYELDVAQLAAIDVHEEVPRLFNRVRIELADGRSVDAYVLNRDQVRGRRRIRSGDWRTRFQVERPAALRDAPFAAWARRRDR